MNIVLRELSQEELEALAWGRCCIGSLSVVEGALPPPPLLLDVFHRIEAGAQVRWIAPWVFVDVDSDTVVGSGGFKGEPQAGRVEIGYGVAECARNCGVATYAVRELVRRALADPNVEIVYAESRTDNTASRRVLQKTGFKQVGGRYSDDDGWLDCWQIDQAV